MKRIASLFIVFNKIYFRKTDFKKGITVLRLDREPYNAVFKKEVLTDFMLIRRAIRQAMTQVLLEKGFHKLEELLKPSSKEAKDKLVSALKEAEKRREADALGELLNPPSKEQIQKWIKEAEKRKGVFKNEQTK